MTAGSSKHSQFGSRVLWSAFGLVVCAPLALVIYFASPLGLSLDRVIIAPALLLLWFIGGLMAAYTLLRSANQRQWRSVAISVLPLALVAVSLVSPLGFLRLCNYAGNAVYFLFNQSTYEQQLNSLPPSREPRLVVFERGGMLWASEGFAYDENDQILLAPSEQSAAWKKRANQTELTCGYGARPLWSHFYVIYLAC